MFNKILLIILCLVICFQTAAAQTKPGKPRARDLGIPFDGAPGQLNAITDVAGVEVGQGKRRLRHLPDAIRLEDGLWSIGRCVGVPARDLVDLLDEGRGRVGARPG